MSLPGITAYKNREKHDLLELENRGELRFYDGARQDGYAVRLRAPATLLSDVDLTFPDTDGTADQVLKTDGDGVLSWTTPVAGSDLSLYQLLSGKNAASGYAGLSAGSKLTLSQMTGLMASSDLTNDSALEKVALKNAASGYAGLSAGSLISTSQLGSGSSITTKFLRGDQSWQLLNTTTGFARNEVTTLTSATGITVDLSTGQNFYLSFTHNVTFTFTGPVDGTIYRFFLKQGTGNLAITFPTVKWKGGSIYSATQAVNSIDCVVIFYSAALGAYLGDIAYSFS